MGKRRLIIEGGSVSEPHVSGVGGTAARLIDGLAESQIIRENFDVNLAVPFNKVEYTLQHRFPNKVKTKKLYLPGKIMNALTKLRLIPPMDIFFGRGVYLFPNFKNWPLIRSKSITYIHDVAFLRFPEYIEKKNLTYLTNHIEEFLRRTDIVVTVSEHAKQEISHFFPQFSHKIRVVYNGIDPKVMYPRSTKEYRDVAMKYGLDAGKYFIFISNIEPRKNVEGLLRAYKIFCDLHDQKRETQLLIIGGKGWNNEAAMNEMALLQKEGYRVVRPRTYVPDEDKPALLSGSIGLVHPAHYEGFGLPPLEAMACGKHVVVGNNSSLPEVVGDAGIYVNENDHDELSEAMYNLYKMREKKNTAGIQRAKQFTWERSAANLAEIINEMTEVKNG